MPLSPNDLRERLTGVIAFPITPFRPDLSVDLDALRQNVRMMLEHPLAAIVAAGGTGELYSLTPAEHLDVVGTIVEEARGKVPVIAGTGFSVALGAQLARQAAAAGASGILVFPPYYPGAEDDGLVRYYTGIGESTSLGMLIYSRDWFHPSAAMVERLASIPTLVAWKDGQGDIRRLQIIKRHIGDRFRWIGGAGDDMMGAVGLLLVIACGNIASLMLARGASREKEISIRVALGADRLRIVRQVLAEAVLLALMAGGLGLLAASGGTRLLASAGIATGLPRLNEITIDARVFLFALVTAVVSALCFGVIPALHASRPQVSDTLKDMGRGASSGASRQRLRSALIVGEVALSVTLLIAAGLLVRSFQELQRVEPGFQIDRVATMTPLTRIGEALMPAPEPVWNVQATVIWWTLSGVICVSRLWRRPV